MNRLAFVLLSVCAGLAGTLTAQGQSATVIYSFTNGPAYAYAGLTLGPDGNFYGTSYNGGTANGGTMFKLTTNGTLTTLVNFNTAIGSGPYAGLTLGPDGNFYGTTFSGGAGYGTVFQVTTNGTLKTLANFYLTNGTSPTAGVTLGPDGSFYGATYSGGSGSSSYGPPGTLFRVTTDGTLTTLVNFNTTNGANPYAGLTLGPDGNLYGVTSQGGSSFGSDPRRIGYGTVFRLTTNGELTTLASFCMTNGADPCASLTLGPDGAFYGTTWGSPGSGYGTVFRVTTSGTLTSLCNVATPYGGLTLGPDGNFYGTTYSGGGGYGTVFRLEFSTLTMQCWLTTLASFNGANGANPKAGLTLAPDSSFYGTTSQGGSSGYGTVFRLTTDGTLTTVANLCNASGASPAGLTLAPEGNFYGVTGRGGCWGYGTVFRLTTDGTLTTVANFNNANGASPDAAPTLARDGYLYGTTYYGGSSGYGTVYQVPTNGNGSLTTVANFNKANGAYPYAGLAVGANGALYGTTSYGGSAGGGTVFMVSAGGPGALVNFDLVDFDPVTSDSVTGASPLAPLSLGPDGNFYGTTSQGGSDSCGTVFRMTPMGTLTTLVNLVAGGGNGAGSTLGPDGNLYGTTYGGGAGCGTVFQVTTNGTLTTLANFNNATGCNPETTLALGPDGNFYGTTCGGGDYHLGTVFRVTTNGTLWTLASFDGTNNGASPGASLTLGPDGNFYGTTGGGGSGGNGTIFRLNFTPGLPPVITAQPADQTAPIGSPARFTASVAGLSPLSYQWYFNGGLLTGATNPTLRISPSLTNEIGSYQLVVTNVCGSVTSRPASLNVLLQPNSYGVSNTGRGCLTVYSASWPDTTNRLWATTNLALNQWRVVSTNVTDSNGLSQFLDTNVAGAPQEFYRLSYP